MILKMSTSY